MWFSQEINFYIGNSAGRYQAVSFFKRRQVCNVMVLQMTCPQTVYSNVWEWLGDVWSNGDYRIFFFKYTMERFKSVLDKQALHPDSVRAGPTPRVSISDLIADHCRYSSHFKNYTMGRELLITLHNTWCVPVKAYHLLLFGKLTPLHIEMCFFFLHDNLGLRIQVLPPVDLCAFSLNLPQKKGLINMFVYVFSGLSYTFCRNEQSTFCKYF